LIVWSAPAGGGSRRIADVASCTDRITIEAWVNTLSWPGRAVVCRKEGGYILYNYSGASPGTSSARQPAAV
jgi:hypothetical protein